MEGKFIQTLRFVQMSVDSMWCLTKYCVNIKKKLFMQMSSKLMCQLPMGVKFMQLFTFTQMSSNSMWVCTVARQFREKFKGYSSSEIEERTDVT